MEGLSSCGVSDEETQTSLPRSGSLKPSVSKSTLFVPSPERGDFWDEVDWDTSSPSSRSRAYSSQSSYWSPGESCRPSVLSLVPGESARLDNPCRTPDRAPVARRYPPAVNNARIVPHDLCQGEFDCQGIPWSRFSISRSDYRAKRVREYSNYNNVNWTARLELQRRQEIDPGVHVGNSTWTFFDTFKSINPTIDHFQLRNLLCSTSNLTTYYVSNSTLYSLNKSSLVSRRVIAGPPQQMACVAVGHGLAATGSFDSELVVKNLNENEIIFRSKMSKLENSITNHVELIHGGRVLVANNDHHLTELDLAVGRPTSTFKWTSAVNHVSTTGNLICLAGDTCDASIIDWRKRPTEDIALRAHLDYVFCSSWKNETTLCTGSQDGTCRVWDTRKPSTPVNTLGTLLGAVRSTKFSANGQFLCFSEPADFVHIYDTENFNQCQVLDFFGNIGGVAFSPDSSKLSVAVADTMFGCIADFQLSTLPINTFKHHS